MNRNDKGKSYNQLMNEWAAQKHFLTRATSSLIKPGHHVTGGARAVAWLWRLLLFTGIPLLVYMGWLRFHGKSGEFSAQLAAETKKYLDAEKVHFSRVRWDMNGELRVERMEATGAPQNFFASIEASNLKADIPVPRVFRKAWHLDSLTCTEAVMALRSGSTAKIAALAPPSLTAGYGLSPDFAQLTIGGYECENLKLTWGSTPSTIGEIAGSKASLVRAGDDGWDFTLAGGSFRQCWLDGLRITRAALHFGPDRVQITHGDFTVPGGGSGSLTGSFTLGEHPEIDAVAKVENLQLEQFLSEYFQAYVKATGQGTVKLTGSTNRSNGILMDATITIQSGSLSRIPVLSAVETATGEGGLSAPEITGGRAHVTSQGTLEPGGYVIESDDLTLDCGTRVKIGLTVRHERKQVMATSLTDAKTRDANAETVARSTKGTFRIGLPPATAAKLKPSIRQQFITREEQGLQWMDIPFSLDEGDFTKAAADKITALHYATE